MSLVGPRPVMPGELDLYRAGADDYLRIRPGVTGHWQITARNTFAFAHRSRSIATT